MHAQTKEDFEILKKIHHSISIAEAMNECLWVGDRNHRTIYVNPVYEQVTGYSLQEAIGKPADFCFDEKSRQMIARHHNLREKGKPSQYEATIIAKDGHKVPVLVSGAPTSAGGSIGIFTNLTKLKSLAKNKKIADQVIRHSTEAIVILDENRQIKLWNYRAEKIFGYSEKEVLKKEISILIPPSEEDANTQLLKDVEEKKFIKNIEAKRQNKNGEIIDVLLSVTKVTDEDGNFVAYLVTYNDITDQKRTSTELQKRFEAIQDAYKELGIQRRQADYIYELVDLAVSPDSNLEAIEKLIVSAACMLTKCDGVVLRSYEQEQNVLHIRSSLGVNENWLAKNRIRLEGSLAENALENKRAIIIDDIENSPQHKGTSLTKAHNFKTLILIPLIFENQFLGTLSLYSCDPAKFRLIERDFLEKFGKQCSLALHVKKP